MRGQKKNLLLAYTNLNFGDDMFVYTISRIFPEQEFVLYAPDSYREVYKNVHVEHDRLHFPHHGPKSRPEKFQLISRNILAI